MQHDIASLFQAALVMESEHTIVIPCRDYKEMESIRAGFYRERNTLKKLSSDLAAEIGIHRRVESGTYAVVLAKLKTQVSRAYLVTREGEVTEIKRTETDEAKRIEDLMLQDGYTTEEIDEYKKSTGEFFGLEEEE